MVVVDVSVAIWSIYSMGITSSTVVVYRHSWKGLTQMSSADCVSWEYCTVQEHQTGVNLFNGYQSHYVEIVIGTLMSETLLLAAYPVLSNWCYWKNCATRNTIVVHSWKGWNRGNWLETNQMIPVVMISEHCFIRWACHSQETQIRLDPPPAKSRKGHILNEHGLILLLVRVIEWQSCSLMRDVETELLWKKKWSVV